MIRVPLSDFKGATAISPHLVLFPNFKKTNRYRIKIIMTSLTSSYQSHFDFDKTQFSNDWKKYRSLKMKKNVLRNETLVIQG